LGYLVGGPETVVKAVHSAVPESTIMMPSFPFSGSMADYVVSDPVYDPENTPTKLGLLPETFRKMEGVKRGYHPTHPSASLGPRADELIDGAEWTETPFGDNSTYGRFCQMDEAVLLLIHNYNHSLVHSIQERADFPNQFLEEPAFVKGYDQDRRIVKYKTWVHTPVIPLYMIMPGDKQKSVEYVWIADYLLLFPKENKHRLLKKMRSEKAKKILLERDEQLWKQGVFKTAKIGKSEILAIRVKPWMERVCEDARKSMEQFANEYDYWNMKSALDKGLLSKY
jgi:hypothetical protein